MHASVKIVSLTLAALFLNACATRHKSPPIEPEKVLLASISDSTAEDSPIQTEQAEIPKPSNQTLVTPETTPAKRSTTASGTPESAALTTATKKTLPAPTPQAINDIHPDDVERYRIQRMAMAEDPNYDPYMLGFLENTSLQEHFTLAKDKNNSIDDLNKPLQTLHEANPLSIRLNLVLARFLKHIGEQQNDSAQKQKLLALATDKTMIAHAVLQSIFTSGDGKSPETAWVVINTPEQNGVLDYLKLKKTTQALVDHQGKPYDLITGEDASGKRYQIYFDVSMFFGKASKG